MQRVDVERIAAGLTVLLLPLAGAATVLPLAVIYYLSRPTRMLCASLSLLLILRIALDFTRWELPLYVIAVSFILPTFSLAASKRFEALAGSLIYLLTTVAMGYPAAIMASGGLLSPEKVLFLCMLGGLSGAFLQHVSRESDFTVPFGSCMVMWLFSFDYPMPELGTLVLIYLFALVLGLGAYWAKAADVDAVLSEIVVCLLVTLFADLSWFLLLLCFYIMGGGFTKYGYKHKHDLGIAQSKGGVRGYKNVYSNSLVPLALAVLYGIYGSSLFTFAFIASVATANGDTLASEIGQTSKTQPRMITTFKPVPTGVDGGITPLGEVSSLLGSMIIGVLAVATGMSGLYGLLAAAIGGFAGTNFDSLLGATLQHRGILSNNGVNLVATLFGATVGGAMWALMFY